MSIPAQHLGTVRGLRVTPHLADGAIWLIGVVIAAFFALILVDSTVFEGAYIPRGNDSFYHARRILDAAVGGRGFYQFDDRLQVPEGSWISWPWAYDYLLAQATRLALWIAPGLDPMAFISYVPVAWILVNAALFMAIARSIGLSREMTLLAMACFALSPLTQLLHAIAMIDHHYVEHTFVLLNAWLGLKWFRQPSDRRSAAAIGIALGLAPAFHNGLFILQLVPLTAAFVLWLRGQALPAKAVRWFCICLLTTTGIVLLPSEPFRRGMFEFGLLSWFHLYVAACTAIALAFMSHLPFTGKNSAKLVAVCALLALPLLNQIASGAGFLSGSFSILDQITEAQSVYRLFTEVFGPSETAGYYSWLVLLAPVLLAYYGYRIWRETDPKRIYYAIAVAFGLCLLLAQLRLHYFGFFGLITGGLLIVDELRSRHRWHRGATFVATFAVIVVAYQPALRERLFTFYAPGADAEYGAGLSIFLDLGRECAADPGVVLANPNDGSPILFHSECSVIANNFILQSADKDHIDEVYRLMQLTPAQIRAQRPDVKYVFVRVSDFSTLRGNSTVLIDTPIARELLIAETPPAGYSLVKTIRRRIGLEGEAGVYAKLFKVQSAAGATIAP